MNKIMKTSCISHLAEEVARLETKSKDIQLTITTLKKTKIAVDLERNALKVALDNVLETGDEI